MSKTIDLQIEKSMTLINALKSKYAEVSEKGIKMDTPIRDKIAISCM